MALRHAVCALVCLAAWSMPATAQAPESRTWPIHRIIARAYDISLQMEPYTMAGGSSRILDRKFDIQATTPDDVPEMQIRPMIRNLLADRFRLRMHWADRRARVYAMRLARPGQFGTELRRDA